MKTKHSFFASMSILAIVLGAFSGGALSASAADEPLLTPIGEQAISDLRTCLASNDALDVYYLIDASGSLFSGSKEATDPNFMRATLAANSFLELASLSDDLKVSYGLGFFGTSFQPSIAWTSVDSSSADGESARIEATIKSQPSLGWTNWEVAIAGAQAQLAEQETTSEGCQILVWLTDGGINVKGNNVAADNAAINNLCGAPVLPGSAPQLGYGHLSELRQAGVVVIGVLLRVQNVSDRDASYMPYMKALVEGQGQNAEGTSIDCGEQPAPEGYVSGAYLQATNPDDLALIFLRLGATVSGGYPSPFSSDGTFAVDIGASRFSLVTSTQDWELTAPNGSIISSNQLGDFDVKQAGAAIRIDSPIIEMDSVGTWAWSSSSPTNDNLYFYSGLALKLNESSTFLAGAQNTLSGLVVRTDGRTVPLNNYSLDLQLAIAAPEGKEAISPETIAFDESTGEFAFTYQANGAPGLITLEATLDNLATRPSGIPLATISALQSVTVTIPDQYPTVTPQPIALSTLEGASGVAVGTLTVSAPKNNEPGKVCFANGGRPTITSDSGDRATSWDWSLSIAEDCVEIASGETTLQLSGANSVPANSDIEGNLEVTYVDSAGNRINGTIPISFHSTRPVNAFAFGFLALLLLLLGLLAPLFGLWLANYFSTTIPVDKHNMRGVIPVRIDPSGTITTENGDPLLSGWTMDHFDFRPNRSACRQLEDPHLGVLRAQIPFNPFGKPWYEIKPKPGFLVFGSRGDLPAKKSLAVRSGKLAGFNGQVGDSWGFVMTTSRVDDPAAETYPATLIINVSNPDSNVETIQKRIALVASDSTVARKLTAAREIRASGHAKDSSSSVAPGAEGNRPQKGTDSSIPPARRSPTQPDDAPPPISKPESAMPPRSSGTTSRNGRSAPAEAPSSPRSTSHKAPPKTSLDRPHPDDDSPPPPLRRSR